MNLKQLLLTFLLIDFVALSAWAMWEVGYLGIWQAGLAGPGSIQILTDLAVGLGIALFFIWRDAKKRNINPVPYTAVTLFAGSIGPLLYLIRRARTA